MYQRLHLALVAATFSSHGHLLAASENETSSHSELMSTSSDILERSITAYGSEDTDGTIDGVTLLQTHLAKPWADATHHAMLSEVDKSVSSSNGSSSSCSNLHNRGSFFSVTVHVGTPPQSFDIVVDTGSQALIIPDCMCEVAEGCNLEGHCFKPRKSKSFLLKKVKSHGWAKTPVATLGYGSGDIDCTIGSDHVVVGEVHAHMNQSVYLMESREKLKVPDSFEGILGLGLPSDDIAMAPFMQQADITRYSLCFNDVDPGVLRVNVPASKNPLSNLGKMHWGLDLQGISVGDTTADVLFCDPGTKEEGAQSACGAIPDSGTTLLMGPQDQIITLFEAICENWDRCHELAARSSAARYASLKSRIFHKLLDECSDWMDNSTLAEMPSVKLHLAGALPGEKQVVEISPSAYVFFAEEPDIKDIRASIFGVEDEDPPSWRKGKKQAGDVEVPSEEKPQRCTAAFSAHSYVTQDNGPVWILGSPLFFENTISYDLGKTPVTMAFDRRPCSTCQASLLADTSEVRVQKRSIRHVPKLRWPKIDLKQPL